MSRIHEALQRAAGQPDTPEAPEDATSALPSEGDDIRSAPPAAADEIGTLSKEPFPVELAAVRRSAPSQERPVFETTAPPKEPPPVEEPAAEPRRTSLFDRIDARLAEKVVVDENMSNLSREQYRRLAAVLHDAQGNSGLKVIMVASGVPGEGKTLTATNISLTLSDSYRRRVLLIDADLRKPTLHQVFRLNTTSGLTDGLDPERDVRLVLRQVSTNLSVLPAGRPTTDPMAGLTSERMRRLIDEAKEAFDWVIIDTPPLMLLPDAHLLSSLVDGAVLVVKAASTPHEMVKRTVEIIGRERILGVVLNQVKGEMQPGYGDYYSHYYLARPKEATR
jgi:capsular exopolysaccharide synthesis family protein